MLIVMSEFTDTQSPRLPASFFPGCRFASNYCAPLYSILLRRSLLPTEREQRASRTRRCSLVNDPVFPLLPYPFL